MPGNVELKRVELHRKLMSAQDVKAHASQRWSFRGAVLMSALKKLRGKLSLSVLDKKPTPGDFKGLGSASKRDLRHLKKWPLGAKKPIEIPLRLTIGLCRSYPRTPPLLLPTFKNCLPMSAPTTSNRQQKHNSRP